MEIKFYRCPICGNLVVKLVDSGVVPECCGQPMTELEANVVDASAEKHVPVAEKTADGKLLVKVGSAPHPMIPAHHIEFIFLETTGGGQLRMVADQEEAVAVFCCPDDAVAVYEFCNLHGLWKAALK